MALAPGTHLGPYEILSLLAAGGMGEVYCARDTSLKRDVAIKVLPVTFATDADRLLRFEIEAEAAAALNHPNVLSIFHIGQQEEIRYLVVELLHGETLREHLQNGPLRLRKTLDIAVGVARGLAAAHHAGVVHRDLKPENLFVTKDGQVKILDFGLAKLRKADMVADERTATLPVQTTPGQVLGTVGYMSPEQVRGEQADARSDIFALGAILHEMLTGRRAFQKPTSAETMSAILNEEPSPISQLALTTPPGLQHIVHCCLEKNADKRFQNASDLAFALEAVSDSSSISVSEKPQTAAVARWSWRTGAVIAGLIGLIVAAFWAFPSIASLRHSTDQALELPMRLELRLPGASFFALSPNGEQIAYSAHGEDGRNLIWVRALNSFESRPLLGSEDATGLMFWSFDSRYVAFQSGNKLKKIEIAGPKPPQVICEAPAFILGGAWNRAGVIIFGTTEGIMQVPATGGVPRFVTVVHNTHYNDAHVFPSFLPNGRQFVYLRDGERPGIYVASLDVNPEEQTSNRIVDTRVMSGYMTPHNGGPGRLLFMHEDVLFAQDFDAKRLELTGEPAPLARGVSKYLLSAYFSASETGVLAYRTGSFSWSRLSWFDRHGQELGDLRESAPSSGLQDLSLSPDGSHLATTRINQTATDFGVALWVTDLTRGVSTRLSHEQLPQGSPAWSADGRYLAFSTTRPDGMAIIAKPVDGSGAEHILVRATPDEKYPNDWSHQAQALLYTRQEAGKDTGLWLADLTGGTDKPAAVRPFIDTSFNEAQGQFSPDSRWIAYASDESGRFEIYVRSFTNSQEGGTRTQVSRDGGHDPRWRRDGRELFYLSNEGKLMSVKVRSGSTFQAEAPEPLFQIQNVHRIASGLGYFSWAVSPDGERFLISRDPPSIEPISIVINWPAEMAK